MAFIPSAAQRVKIAAPAKNIGASLENVLAALTEYDQLYQEAAAVVQAEAEKIITRARLVQVYQQANALREEFRAAVLDYEGADTLPAKEEEP